MAGAQSGIDFSQLLLSAKAGDPAARYALFARLAQEGPDAARLATIAHRLLPAGDPARRLLESQDLVQSALRRGWVDFTQFRGTTAGEFFGWMQEIIRNRVRELVRRKRPLVAEAEVEQAKVPAPTDGFLDAIVREEVKARVREAINRLPEGERVVVEKRLEGKKSKDIATELGLTPDAVRKRESRAAERLREMLG